MPKFSKRKFKVVFDDMNKKESKSKDSETCETEVGGKLDPKIRGEMLNKHLGKGK